MSLSSVDYRLFGTKNDLQTSGAIIVPKGCESIKVTSSCVAVKFRSNKSHVYLATSLA